MKVLMVVPSLRKTGVTEVIKSLILENNKERKIEYELIALREGYPEQEKIFKDIVNLHVFPSKTIFSLAQVLKLNKLINKIKPDIVHFHGFNSEIYIPWMKNNKAKILVTAHNMGREDFVFTYGKFLGTMMSIFQKKIYGKVDCLICVSNSVNQHYQYLGINNVKTVYNGVSIPKKYQDIKLPQVHNSPVGVYVGNLDERKNVKLLLKVFSTFKDRQLFVVGDNPKNSEVLEQYKANYSNSNIHFVGRVTDVYHYLLKADYFISASLAEGLPMAAIEAMGMNLDLILSDIPQHKELVKDKAIQNIYLFSDKKDLEKKLNQYFRNWKKGHISNNKFYFKYFSSHQMYNNYVKYYKEISTNSANL